MPLIQILTNDNQRTVFYMRHVTLDQFLDQDSRRVIEEDVWEAISETFEIEKLR